MIFCNFLSLHKLQNFALNSTNSQNAYTNRIGVILLFLKVWLAQVQNGQIFLAERRYNDNHMHAIAMHVTG